MFTKIKIWWKMKGKRGDAGRRFKSPCWIGLVGDSDSISLKTGEAEVSPVSLKF